MEAVLAVLAELKEKVPRTPPLEDYIIKMFPTQMEVLGHLKGTPQRHPSWSREVHGVTLKDMKHEILIAWGLAAEVYQNYVCCDSSHLYNTPSSLKYPDRGVMRNNRFELITNKNHTSTFDVEQPIRDLSESILVSKPEIKRKELFDGGSWTTPWKSPPKKPECNIQCDEKKRLVTITDTESVMVIRLSQICAIRYEPSTEKLLLLLKAGSFTCMGMPAKWVAEFTNFYHQYVIAKD